MLPPFAKIIQSFFFFEAIHLEKRLSRGRGVAGALFAKKVTLSCPLTAGNE